MSTCVVIVKWNRFANIIAFEQINKILREALIKTKDIVEQSGFELFYADRLFISKEEWRNVA